MLNTSSSWNVGRAAGAVRHVARKSCPTLFAGPLCDGWPVKCAEPAPGAKAEKANGNEPPPSPFVAVSISVRNAGPGAGGRRISIPWHLGSISTGPEGKPAPLAMFSFWKTTVPLPQQKKKLFVDDAVLMDVFTAGRKNRAAGSAVSLCAGVNFDAQTPFEI